MLAVRSIFFVFFVAATLSVAHAKDTGLAGKVEATHSRWSGDVIVTESDVRSAAGNVARVVQLGGVVDGIGMLVSHTPDVLRVGDDVALEVTPGVTTSGAPALVVVGADLRVSVSAMGGTGAYGVQRTTHSNIPVWRDSGCLDMIYDTTTVTDEAARVLDDSFATWTTATATCGGLSIASTRQSVIAAAHDGRSTVHIRTDNWCRPATRTEPQLCYAPEASAVTRLIYIDDVTATDDGRILEADMELNGVNFVLLAPGKAPPATTKLIVDLQSVTTHEAGHVLGLAHDCGTGREAWPTDYSGTPVPACDGLAPSSIPVAATMYYRIDAGDTRARTVEASDMTGACAIARELSCERYVEGGCSASGRRSSLWVAVAALLVLRRRRRR